MASLQRSNMSSVLVASRQAWFTVMDGRGLGKRRREEWGGGAWRRRRAGGGRRRFLGWSWVSLLVRSWWGWRWRWTDVWWWTCARCLVSTHIWWIIYISRIVWNYNMLFLWKMRSLNSTNRMSQWILFSWKKAVINYFAGFSDDVRVHSVTKVLVSG